MIKLISFLAELVIFYVCGMMVFAFIRGVFKDFMVKVLGKWYGLSVWVWFGVYVWLLVKLCGCMGVVVGEWIKGKNE